MFLLYRDWKDKILKIKDIERAITFVLQLPSIDSTGKLELARSTMGCHSLSPALYIHLLNLSIPDTIKEVSFWYLRFQQYQESRYYSIVYELIHSICLSGEFKTDSQYIISLFLQDNYTLGFVWLYQFNTNEKEVIRLWIQCLEVIVQYEQKEKANDVTALWVSSYRKIYGHFRDAIPILLEKIDIFESIILYISCVQQSPSELLQTAVSFAQSGQLSLAKSILKKISTTDANHLKQDFSASFLPSLLLGLEEIERHNINNFSWLKMAQNFVSEGKLSFAQALITFCQEEVTKTFWKTQVESFLKAALLPQTNTQDKALFCSLIVAALDESKRFQNSHDQLRLYNHLIHFLQAHEHYIDAIYVTVFVWNRGLIQDSSAQYMKAEILSLALASLEKLKFPTKILIGGYEKMLSYYDNLPDHLVQQKRLLQLKLDSEFIQACIHSLLYQTVLSTSSQFFWFSQFLLFTHFFQSTLFVSDS